MIYVALLSLLHFFGAFIYALPWYSPRGTYLVQSGANAGAVASGFMISLIGLIGFAIGVVVVQQYPCGRSRQCDRQWISHWWLIVAGLVFKVILTPLLNGIPGMSAVLSTGSQLSVVGFLLAALRAWKRRELKNCAWWTAAALVIPLVTAVSSGFIGYGVTSLIIIALFMQRYIRRSGAVALSFGVFAYLGLSLWVTYARDRDEVRAVVWGGGDLSARINQVAATLLDYEIFDPNDQSHLEFIDMRLNQNLFVGQAVEYMATGAVEAANGETIGFSLIAWIPRVVWPGKPEFGGSGDMVATYTGRYFSETSSFGVGQILEFYINFRIIGVFLGMAALGVGISLLDREAAFHLSRGDSWGFVVWFLPMMAAIQPGGALSEVVASAAAAGVLLFILHQFKAHIGGIHDISGKGRKGRSLGSRVRRVRRRNHRI